MGTVTRLRVHKAAIRAAVLPRYRKLRDKGRPDEESRNVAAAQAATAPGARLPSHVFRRELDALLDKRPDRQHWRLP